MLLERARRCQIQTESDVERKLQALDSNVVEKVPIVPLSIAQTNESYGDGGELHCISTHTLA